jgi:hypothetical protein
MRSTWRGRVSLVATAIAISVAVLFSLLQHPVATVIFGLIAAWWFLIGLTEMDPATDGDSESWCAFMSVPIFPLAIVLALLTAAVLGLERLTGHEILGFIRRPLAKLK